MRNGMPRSVSEHLVMSCKMLVCETALVTLTVYCVN
jgi:hypothetical protein